MRAMLDGPEFGTCVDELRPPRTGTLAWSRVQLGAVLDGLGCPRGILRPVAHCA
jgi:hypothetical protein